MRHVLLTIETPVAASPVDPSVTSTFMHRAVPLAALAVASYFCPVFVTPAVCQATVPAPLAIEDVLQINTFPHYGGSSSFSPDGTWLAYAVANASHTRVGDGGTSFHTKTGVGRENEGSTVWIVNIKTGQRLNLTPGEGNSWRPLWSPNGKSIAFYSDRDGAARVWVWDVATERLRRVSGAVVRSLITFESMSWAPDGRHLVVRLLPEGKTIDLANAESAGETTAQATIRGSGAPIPGATVTVFRAAAGPPVATVPTSAPPVLRVLDTMPEGIEADLGVIDVATGHARRLARNVVITGYWLSPDGTRLAYMRRIAWQRNTNQPFYDLLVVPLTGGVPRVVAPLVPQHLGYDVSWSPDGRMLGFITGGEVTASDVYVVALDGSALRPIAKGIDSKGYDRHIPLWTPSGDALVFVGSKRLWRAPVTGHLAAPVTVEGWDHDVTSLVAGARDNTILSPDGGRSAYVMTFDNRTQDMGIYTVDCRTGRATKLIEENKTYDSPVAAPDGRSVVYLAEDAEHDQNLWVAGIDFHAPRQVTTVNPQLAKYTFGASLIVEYHNAQGAALQGALLLPANFHSGTRYPIVVFVYPGEGSYREVANRFGLWGAALFNLQLLATRGYAVLFPQAPQRVGSPMRDMADAILPAIDKVIELGIADSARIGIFGHSYGGYAVISMLVQSPRFGAAVMEDGVADLTSAYGMLGGSGSDNTGMLETGQFLMGGTLWQYRDRYLENSPILYLDRVHTPLLIVHGEKDPAAPVWEGDAVFVGLRRLGKEVEYRRYVGEGHWTASYVNSLDNWTSVLRWFDTHLKEQHTPIGRGSASAAPTAEGGPP